MERQRKKKHIKNAAYLIFYNDVLRIESTSIKVEEDAKEKRKMKYKKDRETSSGKILKFVGGHLYNIVVTDNDNVSTI